MMDKPRLKLPDPGAEAIRKAVEEQSRRHEAERRERDATLRRQQIRIVPRAR